MKKVQAVLKILKQELQGDLWSITDLEERLGVLQQNLQEAPSSEVLGPPQPAPSPCASLAVGGGEPTALSTNDVGECVDSSPISPLERDGLDGNPGGTETRSGPEAPSTEISTNPPGAVVDEVTTSSEENPGKLSLNTRSVFESILTR